MSDQTVARQQLHALYQECVNCPNTTKECPGIRRDLSKGFFPDGFHFEAVPIDALVVAKNTGHPQAGESKFTDCTVDSLYPRLLEVQKDFYQNHKLSEQRDNFSKYMALYLCEILEVPEKDLFTRMAFTNLVKCPTIRESDVTLHADTMKNCFHKYLKNEVALLRPKVILALGRDAEDYLIKRSWRYLGVPVLFLKHTSRPLKKEDKPKELAKIREEINYFINKAKE